MAESAEGDARYLLSDGLGSVRQAVDENAELVAYNEFDPYGNPVEGGGEPYGFTGEWWESDVSLLHLRARWYQPYGRDAAQPTAVKLSSTEGLYPAIPIFNIFNERGFALGKFFLQGDFIAENIQKHGNSVTADITINRFIDDIFRFDDDDFGGIPFHKKFSSWPNPGFGDMPHAWLHELQKNNMVSNVDVRMRWEEKFHFDSIDLK